MMLILLLSIAVAVQAATQIIQVAPGGSFTYSPNSVTAAVGDTIEFQFESNVSLLWHNSFAEPLSRASGFLESMSAVGWRYTLSRVASINVQEYGQVLLLQLELLLQVPQHKEDLQDTNVKHQRPHKPALWYVPSLPPWLKI